MIIMNCDCASCYRFRSDGPSFSYRTSIICLTFNSKPIITYICFCCISFKLIIICSNYWWFAICYNNISCNINFWANKLFRCRTRDCGSIDIFLINCEFTRKKCNLIVVLFLFSCYINCVISGIFSCDTRYGIINFISIFFKPCYCSSKCRLRIAKYFTCIVYSYCSWSITYFKNNWLWIRFTIIPYISRF